MKEVTAIKELSWLKFLWKAGAGEVSKDQAGCSGDRKAKYSFHGKYCKFIKIHKEKDKFVKI